MHCVEMISRLRKYLRAAKPSLQKGAAIFAQPCPETDLYVVGDIHGRSDLLIDLAERLLARVEAENREWRIVFVGDYIDRGEESSQVLSLLHLLVCSQPERILCLRGNHEQMMLNFLQNPVEHGAKWLNFGGLQTLASFGLRGNITAEASAEQMLAVAQDFRRLLPAALIDWLRSLPLVFQSGNVCVVHAGANPALPITDQPAATLLWGHPNFTKIPRDDGLWIVHGHTIVRQATVQPGRIAVDTGAVFSGILTAAIISTDGVIDFAT
jgi:serine/threonine protein phosphatase 1